MLTKDEDDGFLIDLDLAVRVTNDAASGAPTKTGTRVFMSIGALSGENHTFKDDLESFFWVLFWICLHWSGAGQRRKKSGYEDWNYMASHKLATFKGGIVWKEDNFERTLKRQFTQECKPLIPCMKRLRSDVFPEGQSLDENDRQLYSRMKETLVSARQALAAV
ncbi:MAG: hypothetical protein M1832_000777 [Thelocarpon impressellum]|nr:MAG: hypothetical protein M1832_000777 [Thelocarpon impressellum]